MKGGTRKRGKTWSYYFDAAPIGGKRKKIEKGGFRTKKEAESALAKAMAEYDASGSIFAPAEISVSDYLDFWFEEDCKMNCSDKTAATYENIIRNHLKPQFGAYYLKTLHAAPIQSYINKMKKDGYSKSTIQVMLAILSSSLDYAVEPMRYIKENPCRYARIGSVPKPPRTRTVLTCEQFSKILALYPFGSRFHIPLLLGWNCGLRINECFGLTWDDVDFDAKTITVSRQLSRNPTPKRFLWAVKDPKYNSKRVIPFGEMMYRALKAEKKRQIENELLYGQHYTIQYLSEYVNESQKRITYVEQTAKSSAAHVSRFPLLCVDENGKMTSESTFRHCARRISRLMDIPFDYHCLRHTHATKLVETGVNATAVQKRLGHKQISTTLMSYVHHTDSMAQEAVTQFEMAVNSNLPPQ